MFKRISAVLALSLLLCGSAWAETLTIKRADINGWPKVEFVTELPVADTNTENYRLVLQDGKSVTATSVTELREATSPPTVVVLMDTSRSLSPAHLEAAKSALGRYLDELDQNERLALISFNDNVKLVNGFTTDRDAFQRGLDSLTLEGDWTQLYRGMMHGMELLKGEDGRRMLLVITDGKNEGSDINPADIINTARENSIRIATIGVPGLPGNQSNRFLPLMASISQNTGGMFRAADSANDLNQAVYRILVDQRNSSAHVYDVTFDLPEAVYSGKPTPLNAMLVHNSGNLQQSIPVAIAIPASHRMAAAPQTQERLVSRPANATESVIPAVAADTRPLVGHEFPANRWLPWAILAGLMAVVAILVLMRKNRDADIIPRSTLAAPMGSRLANEEAYVLTFPELNLEYPLDAGTMVLGSGKDVAMSINDPSIEEIHAEFCMIDGTCHVSSMISGDGLLLNGSPVRKRTVLKPGDVLQIGSVRAFVQRRADAMQR